MSRKNQSLIKDPVYGKRFQYFFSYLVETACEALNYTLLDDASRNDEYEFGYNCDKTGYSYQSPDWKGTGWYRMVEPAGTMIPLSMTTSGIT